MKTKLVILLLTVLSITSTIAIVAAEDQSAYQVVINPSNPVSSLTKAQTTKLFLKKVTRWDNGQEVLPVDQLETSSLRERFSLEVIHREVSSVKSYWQQMIFSGRAIPPPEKSSDSEVIKYVQANPGAIGYISISASTEGLKVPAIK